VGLRHPYVPRELFQGPPAGAAECHESSKFVEVCEGTAQGVPDRSPQGSPLRYQQAQPTVQGPPGLTPAGLFGAKTHISNKPRYIGAVYVVWRNMMFTLAYNAAITEPYNSMRMRER
jgi:hypothetical protein